MSTIQRIFKAFMPNKWYVEMESESRQWRMKCRHCNHEHSVWDLGGIRYKAAGRPTRYITCPNCGKGSWQTLFKNTH